MSEDNSSKALLPFSVVGAHPNGNLFILKVHASDAMKSFGAAAELLHEAGEEGEAMFFAATPGHSTGDDAVCLPGDSVVSLSTVMDPDQADVFGFSPQGLPVGDRDSSAP